MTAASISELATSLAQEANSTAKVRKYSLGPALLECDRTLRKYAEGAAGKSDANGVAEWVIDNYPLLHTLIREVKTSLPKQFYRCLPGTKASTSNENRARIDVGLQALVDQTGGAVSGDVFQEFIDGYQQARTLSTAELWSSKHLLHFHLVNTVAQEISKPSPDIKPIAAAITSLRKLEPFDWKTFVESSLAVEKILYRDPSGHYPNSDFSTRDLYRHAVEMLARKSLGKQEDEADAELRVAQAAVDLAASSESVRQRHVGFWLVDKGLPRFRKTVGFRQKAMGSLRDFIKRYPSFHYLGFTLLFTILIVAAIATLLSPVPWWTLLFVLLPALHVSLAILNPLVTFTLPPKLLPRLDFLKGVPEEFKTVVVVPTLLLSPKNLKELLENLEIHYLANRDKNILFALLTDFADASTAQTRGDNLLDICIRGIEELNNRYSSSGQRPFFLFHRPRQWNAAECKWMGWERKRGKLTDFNEWLLGKTDYFSAKIGDLDQIRNVKYVITLDSDTQLPRDTARKMIGMLAHPLNQAVVDPDRQIVTEGYGLLLPRVGVSVQSSARSRLARLYSGKIGYDPYATAVSDVYMDLFGQASFTGKGIYDVAVFEQAAGRFPENTLLSHDLIEGEHVRVGLCADQEVIDDFPQRYEAFCKRKHRWVRGDWQIIRWLTGRVPDRFNGSAPNPLPLISRWKIFDNLRRSLMEISFFLWFAAAWTVLPGDGLRWTLVALALFVLPVWFDLIVAAIRIPPPRFIRPYIREVSYRFVQGHLDALVTLVFLPHQALLMADAIVRTLVRQFITRKNLLEWESMAAAEAATKSSMSLPSIYLWVASVLALLLIVIVPGGESWSGLAFGLLELWLVSPLVALWLDSAPAQPQGLTDADRQFLRDIGLATWRYFADFANDENNWLIPDNVQEQPPAIAHRTSPTNLGLQLNAYLTALDFGYITTEEFALITARTLDSMDRLPRSHGHWFNWYDTRTLALLPPNYISSVDSGNLAASLVVTKQGCLEAMNRKIAESSERRGLIDFVLQLRNALPKESRSHNMMRVVDSIVQQLNTEPAGLFFWEGLLSETRSAVQRLEQSLEVETDADVTYWLKQLRARVQEQTDHLCRFAPWMCEALEREFRFSFNDPAMEHLLGLLSANPTYHQLPEHYDRIAESIDARLESRRSMHELTRQALHHLAAALPQARGRVVEMVESLQQSADMANAWVDAMDFGFLFDEKRSLLRIGAEITPDGETKLDESYYDLLASEARTAVLLGIAKGEMPRDAWFQLGRKLTHWHGQHCLLSWSGTMFEYLMPNLYMRTYPGTLLHETTNAVVRIQRGYAKEQRIPWGMSESACNTRDDLLNYQYHAFGIPWLRARRDISGRTVVAPYATMLSLLSDPLAAVANARLMASKGWVGRYGFVESIDYTAARGFGRGDEPAVVHAFMAHHQGMTLMAIDAAVLDSPMQKRFHSDPLVQAAEYLLQERAPEIVPESDEMPASIVLNERASHAVEGTNEVETSGVESVRESPTPEFFQNARG